MLNTEVRPFTKDELNSLIKDAPESEKFFLNAINEPFDFFSKYALETCGLIIDGRPIYFGALLRNQTNDLELWTVVNSNVKQQFSLFKYSKKVIYDWLDKYKEIYATMPKLNKTNIQWTKRIGFKVVNEDPDFIVFKLTEGEV